MQAIVLYMYMDSNCKLLNPVLIVWQNFKNLDANFSSPITGKFRRSFKGPIYSFYFPLGYMRPDPLESRAFDAPASPTNLGSS